MNVFGRALILHLATLLFAGESFAQAPALRIVIIAGEDAVNVIQRNTATAPIVEVRDRNDLPVAGVTVTFRISSSNAAAFAAGAQVVTVTTAATGRASAPALTPQTAGRFQIAVQASYQGEIATATISQVNVLTAAAAATAGGAAASGAAAGAAAGAGAGAGAGLSGAAIGAIVGGAAAGGTLVAVKAKKGGGDDDKSTTGTTFTGLYSGQVVLNTTISNGTACTGTFRLDGTLTLNLNLPPDGSVTGTANITGTESVVSNCNGFLANGPNALAFPNGPVSGTSSAFTFSLQNETTPQAGQPDVRVTRTMTFTGGSSNGIVNGTLTYTETSIGHQLPPGTLVINANGSTSMSVSLR